MNPHLPSGSDDPKIVGTNAWAANGGTPLSFWQKLEQLMGANRAYLEELPGELRWVLSSRGLAPPARVPALGMLALPKTAAVESAIAVLEQYAEGETEIANHSYRTFHFADLLHRQSVPHGAMDREVLAVVTLLHDVGMYPKAVADIAGNDFTVRGANLARQVGQEVGWPQHRIDLAAQAITINANGRVSRHWGAEAYFGRLAPLVDAIGQCWKIHSDDAKAVFADRPAGELGTAIVRAVTDEATRHPNSRFALFKPLFPFLVMNCKYRWHKHLNG
ncbi:MAG: hypothetical protein Q8R92_05625 [Deltaproteobacteria bacterium]|nr:hypothetical protein [Deltaproteobacteria bacterium]